MTDEKLDEFEDADVIGTTIAVTRAGDGLSAALAIEPRALHLGDTVYVVLECEVSSVGFVAVPKLPGKAMRQHKLATQTATLVDPTLVADVLDAQREKLEADKLRRLREKEAAAGVQRVPGTEPWDDDSDDLPEPGDAEDES
jgi:hypothetical protein